MSFSLTLLLSLGTSLFTLVALGPKNYMNVDRRNKSEFNKLDPQNLFKLFTDTLKNEPKFLFLASVDIAKLFLSLLVLSWAPNLTLWFFLIFADGMFIFFFQKVKEQMIIEKRNKERSVEGKEVEEQGVTVTKSKIIGFLVLLLANVALIIVAQSTVTFVANFYALLSMLEFQILETGAAGKPLTYMGVTSQHNNND